jgi:hypothetical protein
MVTKGRRRNAATLNSHTEPWLRIGQPCKQIIFELSHFPPI